MRGEYGSELTYKDYDVVSFLISYPCDSFLQVSEWMKSRDVYNFTPVQHAVQLDLIGKVHGFLQAESYFNSLSEQEKNDKVYGALLHCYVRQRETERALVHLKAIRDKGLPLSSLAFNDIMCLYASTDEIDKVPEVFEQMKQHGIQPDNMSYRICINSFGVRSDIEGLEKILNEMENDAHITMDWNTYSVVANFYEKAGLKHKANSSLRKAEERIDNKDALGYNHLISLHARLGNRDDVLRLWYDEKIACKRRLNKEYINMMEALVRLDEVDEAEEVLKEWEASKNCYDFRVPNVVIAGCIEKGLCEKAEVLLDQLTETGKVLTPNIWGRLAREYIAKGKIENGLESLQRALSLHDPSKELKLNDKVISGVLRLIGEKGSCDDAERVLNLLRAVVPLERQMYHTLLKAYITSGKHVDRLISIMRSDDHQEDEETFKILSLQENIVY